MPPRDDDDDYDYDRPRRRPRRDDRDDEDDGRRRRPRGPQSNGLALGGLIVGVVSLVLPPLGVVALILSGIGLARAGSLGGAGKGRAVGGLVTGVLALVVSAPLMIGAVMIYSVGKVRDAAGRVHEAAAATNNAKQVALAVVIHNDVRQRMPAAQAAGPGAAGGPGAADPATRLGWRADVLPHLDAADASLYDRLDFAEAWDGPKNRPWTSTPVASFADPADGAPTNQTRLRGFTGNGAVFDPDPKLRLTPAKFSDGMSNTIVFVDAAQTVAWAQDNELPFAPAGPLPALGHPNRKVFYAAFADGSVRPVRKDVSPAALRAAITYAGGETLGLE